MLIPFVQTQQKAEPVPFRQDLVPNIRWFEPFSEPVRHRIRPALAIALAASGLIAPVLTPTQILQRNEAPWHQPWSEPKRFKPALGVQYQQPVTFLNLEWMRFTWRWSAIPFGEPVRQKRGLAHYLQQPLAHPPQLRPTAQVTLSFSATEVNADSLSFDVLVNPSFPVYVQFADANVTINEIPNYGDSSASIVGDTS